MIQARWLFVLLPILLTHQAFANNICEEIVPDYSTHVINERIEGKQYKEQLTFFNTKIKPTLNGLENNIWKDFSINILSQMLKSAYKEKVFPGSEPIKNLDVMTNFSKKWNMKCRVQAEDYYQKLKREAERKYQQALKKEAMNRRSGSSKSIIIRADCVGFACVAEDLSLTSNSSNVTVNDLSGSSVSLYSYNGNFAGSYNYSIKLSTGSSPYCSGSFNLNGDETQVTINVYESSCSPYLSRMR